MNWQDEGYLLSKNIFDENSIIIEAFTLNHGKFNGIVYGGSSRKKKKFFQIGNKILLDWNSKNENKIGYFNTELIKPISPLFFDDKKRSICVLASSSLLKILLPERQINKQIYRSFELLINHLDQSDWIENYIHWELQLIKELGYDIDVAKMNDQIDNLNKNLEINGKFFKIPDFFSKKNVAVSKHHIKEALQFNKAIFAENVIIPNKLNYTFSRLVLEKYFN